MTSTEPQRLLKLVFVQGHQALVHESLSDDGVVFPTVTLAPGIQPVRVLQECLESLPFHVERGYVREWNTKEKKQKTFAYVFEVRKSDAPPDFKKLEDSSLLARLEGRSLQWQPIETLPSRATQTEDLELVKSINVQNSVRDLAISKDWVTRIENVYSV